VPGGRDGHRECRPGPPEPHDADIQSHRPIVFPQPGSARPALPGGPAAGASNGLRLPATTPNGVARRGVANPTVWATSSR
jgi:hypothetical protein